MFRKTALAALAALTLAGTAAAQSVPLPPSGPYPEPGTFCAPFQPCQPEVPTRAAGL